MTTMIEFAAEIEFKVRIVHGPSFKSDGNGWNHDRYALHVTSKHDRKGFQTSWSQGLAITTRPDEDPALVLDSLIMDASVATEHDSADDFAESFGYDDITTARQLWHRLQVAAPKIINLIGGDLDAITAVERL